MGGLTSAVHWWEESQLRVLVLTSLLIQFLLFIFSLLRTRALPGWVRFMMWLSYLGSDAVAIYALATLFNRHKHKSTGEDGGSNGMLEVVWAPILLIHLGGHDGVTAYNIEDNELWSRHLLTAVSQVTVAIYVFCKTWVPGGDKRLLQAAIMLFVPGVLKCFQKPLALKGASIYSLVSSSAAVKEKEGVMYVLEDYVKRAKRVVRAAGTGSEEVTRETSLGHNETSKLFVDLSSPYSRRVIILEDFCRLTKYGAYYSVRKSLANTFLLLYTKVKTVNAVEEGSISLMQYARVLLVEPLMKMSRMFLPMAAILVFHDHRREAYNDIDVKITYVILCCTVVLEFTSFFYVKELMFGCETREIVESQWPEMVAQYSFIGYSARNIKHSKMMRIVSLLGCKGFLDQQWCMKPSFFAARFSYLVLRYLKDGWKEKIHDATSYRRFNNHRSSEGLRLSIKRGKPLLFDESVLLWHIATDFCFVSTSSDHSCAFDYERNSSTGHTDCSEELTDCKAVLCTQMSNYMAYLLLVNPEMLLPGSRRNLFAAAHEDIKAILEFDSEPDELDNKREFTRKIITWLRATPSETIIHEAWMLAQKLQSLGHEKMWEVIQGVWVEMLCFSASRCRGYLHAKALGSGGEFLSYIWLLMFYMGMEAFTDKLRRDEEEEESTNNAATIPSTSERASSTTTGTSAPSTSYVAPSAFEICITE